MKLGEEHVKVIVQLKQSHEEEMATHRFERTTMLKKQEVIFMQVLDRKYEEYQNHTNLLKIEINVLVEKLKLKEREI